MNARFVILSILSVIIVVVYSDQLKQWADCVPNNASRELTIYRFDYPSVITFPGQMHFNLSMSFDKNITNGTVDIEIIRYIFGFPITLPCKIGTIIGTCENRDVCRLLNLSVNYNNTDYYGYKFQRIMETATNHTLKCPIKKENITITNQMFEFGEIASTLHLLADGDYTVKLALRQNQTVTGCVKANLTIGAGYPGQSVVG